MNPPFLLGILIPFAAFNVFQNCSGALPEKTVSDKFHSKACVFFFSGLTDVNEIEMRSQHTLFLRQEKEGTETIRNQSINIFLHFSLVCHSWALHPSRQWGSSAPSLTTQLPALHLRCILPASWLQQNGGPTAQGCRDRSPSKSGCAVAEQAQQSNPQLPGSWSPRSAVLKFRHLRSGSQLCWHNRIGGGSRIWCIKNIVPDTLSLAEIKWFSTRRAPKWQIVTADRSV